MHRLSSCLLDGMNMSVSLHPYISQVLLAKFLKWRLKSVTCNEDWKKSTVRSYFVCAELCGHELFQFSVVFVTTLVAVVSLSSLGAPNVGCHSIVLGAEQKAFKSLYKGSEKRQH